MFRLFLSNLRHGRSIFGQPERPECVAHTRHTLGQNRPKMAFFWTNGPKSPISHQNTFGPKFFKNVLIGLQTSQSAALHGANRSYRFWTNTWKSKNFEFFFRKIPFWLEFSLEWDFSKKKFKNFRFSSVHPELKWAVYTMECGEIVSLGAN